ncbi:MAG: glucose-6-phosphate isomerase, partial [Oscillospiraceae bacterium]|nr:glucose-6-phosphate isomerase [Oscillospiraceae bacterium]
EGKDGKGIFPASVTFTTDLHSLGQIIQAGNRNIFETVIFIKNSDKAIFIENDADDLDELNYISKQHLSMHDINKCAFKATVMAHVSGGVPNILFELDSRDAANFGYMVYFFELACAVSGYMLGVNPFDQPGVEEYKNNMFELLGKNKNK